MKIVTFNVNGLRSRLHQLEALISSYAPDIIALQEIKVADEQFPLEDIERLGYFVEYFGQKGHYGVATLSKKAATYAQKSFPDDAPDAQRRLLTTGYDTADGLLHVINGYFPQGESRAHETKFPAKQKFYSDLQSYLSTKFQPDDHMVVLGDFNISPEDKDIGIGEDNRKRWLRTGKCSFLPEEREWLGAIHQFGLKDTYRKFHPESTEKFSWFDYRSKGFEREPKRGLRIDYLLATSPLYDRCISTDILYDIRSMDKPSDHCPVLSEFEVS